MRDVLLYLLGGVGAAIYAFPMYLAAIQQEPPLRFAVPVLVFSLFVGTMLAPTFVPLLGHRWPFLVDPEPYPLAVAVGLAANPLAPIFVKRLKKWAETYGTGGKKP